MKHLLIIKRRDFFTNNILLLEMPYIFVENVLHNGLVHTITNNKAFRNLFCNSQMRFRTSSGFFESNAKTTLNRFTENVMLSPKIFFIIRVRSLRRVKILFQNKLRKALLFSLANYERKELNQYPRIDVPQIEVCYVCVSYSRKYLYSIAF